MIHVFSNSLGPEELEAVADVFSSRWLGKGKHCDEFEREFAENLRVPRVLLTNSCTSAISIAVRVLEIGSGDEVIVSTVNFVACASAVMDVGAVPIFADVDPRPEPRRGCRCDLGLCFSTCHVLQELDGESHSNDTSILQQNTTIRA